MNMPASKKEIDSVMKEVEEERDDAEQVLFDVFNNYYLKHPKMELYLRLRIKMLEKYGVDIIRNEDRFFDSQYLGKHKCRLGDKHKWFAARDKVGNPGWYCNCGGLKDMSFEENQKYEKSLPREK